MKKIGLFLLMLSQIYISFSQGPTYYNFTDCPDTLYYTSCNYDSLISGTKTKFVVKYINCFYTAIKKYVDIDNINLQMLDTKVRNSNKAHFVLQTKEDSSETEIIIETKIEKHTVYNPKYLEEIAKNEWQFKEDAFDAFEKIIIDSTIHYGRILISPNSQYEFIKSIKLINAKDTIIVPDSLINDFVFPNFVNQYEGFSPIKAYYNKEKQYFAIYIYSDLGEDNLLNRDNLFCFQERSSYLIKLIIDIKNRYVGRLIVNSDYLTRYGICNCPNFWIF